MAPRQRTLPQLRFGEPVAGPSPASAHTPANPGHSWPSGRNEESRFTATRRGQTAKAFLPASNALSSLKSFTATPRGLVCRTSSPSLFPGLAVGVRVHLSPSTVRPFTANGPRIWGHSRFSPAAFGPRAGRLSVQHFTLHQPEQGRRGLSFVVEGAAASRPSRHPISGMSSFARHSASSIAFHSRMGASTGGIALGSPHDSVRLHTSVWEKSPRLQQGSTDSSKQRLQGFCFTARAFLPPTERSDRGNISVWHRTRVLQPLLPCSKEGRRPEAHHGSAVSEFFPLQREVQDADDENHVSDSRRGLVCHYRPKGCVFPHPGRSATQKVPSVCLRREGLPIQGPSLRPGLGAENIHEMHGCCTGPFEAPGHSCAELPGRLAHSGSLQGASESSQRYCSTPHPFSWLQDERQEECAPPISANPVSGGSFGFHSDAGPFGSNFTACLARFKLGRHVSVGSCRRLLGLMAAASPVLPLALLHMRPFLWWMKELRLHPTVPATRFIRVSRSCSRPLLEWRDPTFFQNGARMGAIHRRHMVTTDASMTGWGAVFESRPASGNGQESSSLGT